MSCDELRQSIRENLNGRSGQPMLFGVCQSLASRNGHEPWVYRLVTLILAVFFTFPTVAAYIVIALFLDETSNRTQGVFKGLVVTIREAVDKFAGHLGDGFQGNKGHRRPH